MALAILPVLGQTCAAGTPTAVLLVGLAALACSSHGGATPEAPGQQQVLAPAAAPSPSEAQSPQDPAIDGGALSRGTVYTIKSAPLLQLARDKVQEAEVEGVQVGVSCSGKCSARYVQLDGHPLRVAEKARSLASLLNEDEEIAVGQHLISAYAVEGQLLFVEQRVLWVQDADRTVGPSSQTESLPAGCALVFPSGTYNGGASGSIELLALPVPLATSPSSSIPATSAITYTVTQQGWQRTGIFPVGTSARLSAAPAGDLLVRAACEAGDPQLMPVMRTITVNPELGVPANSDQP